MHRRIVAVLLCCHSGCALESLEPEASLVTYWGTVEDSDAVIAITLTDSAAVAYVCGGELTRETHTRWYSAELSRPLIEGDSLVLGANNGQQLELQLSADSLIGSYLDPEGTAFNFDAVVPSQGEFHGLYTVVDSGCRTGVIVNIDASNNSEVQGAWCNETGIFEQVTPIAPINPGASSFDVNVVSAAAGFEEKRLTVEMIDPISF